MKNSPTTTQRKPYFLLTALIAIVLMNLVLPLLALLAKSVDYTPFYKGFATVLSSSTTRSAIFNSLKVTLISCVISISAAFFFAYIVEYKLSHKMRVFFRFFALMTMLVPSITHGIVIVYLFGKMGIFTRLFGLNLPIYGPLGIVMGSFFYAFPTAFLVLSQGFANLDGRLFENAVILGAKPMRRFFDVVLPVMKYSVFSAFAVVFTMVFTDYGIPLSVGGTYSILPLLFYKNVIGAGFFQGRHLQHHHPSAGCCGVPAGHLLFQQKASPIGPQPAPGEIRPLPPHPEAVLRGNLFDNRHPYRHYHRCPLYRGMAL